MKGNLQEEKRTSSPTCIDQMYSEREANRLVKKNMMMDQINPKGMNEDIPIEMKATKKKKTSKTRRNPSKTGMMPSGIYESNVDYWRSQQKKNSDGVVAASPKKKYEDLKTKYVKLNEHLKRADVFDSARRKAGSKSPARPHQIFTTPSALNVDHSMDDAQEMGKKESQKSMVINLEINKNNGTSETVKDIESPIKATSPL